MRLINKFVTARNKRLFLILILIILVSSLLSIWPIRLIESIVNLAKPNETNNISRILGLGVLYFAFQIAGSLLNSLFTYLSAFLQNDIGVSIQNALYSKLLRVDLCELEGKNSLEITNTLIEDTDFISNNLVLPLTKFLSSVALFVIGLIFMLNINKMLTLIILPCGLITSLSARAIQNKSTKNISEKRNKSTQLWKTFAEGIRGIMPIRIYRYDMQYKDIVFNAGAEMKKVSLAQSKLENLSLFMVSSLFMVTIGVIMIFSSVFVINGYITIGGLTAVLMYNHMLVDPLISVLDIQQNIIKLTVSLNRTRMLFELPDDKNADKKTSEIDSIVLKNISYAYVGTDCVLNNVSLNICSPRNICIMGKSGSGKTTLANVIAGLYTPAKGETFYYRKGVKVDGVPKISYLIQDGYLFDTSIEQNIKIASLNISDTQFKKILRICCLEDVLAVHKDSPIGENGGNLSGGERKRVRIAQMLAVDNADIFIFDELTSSLDEMTAKKILHNILELRLGKICIFIEHDTTVQAFMDETLIVESGNINFLSVK